MDIPSYNQITFGRKVLTFFGQKTWNSLPYQIKTAENFASSKTMIKFLGWIPAVVQFVVKGNLVLIWLDGNLCLEIQGYQKTHAFVDPELKLNGSKSVVKNSSLLK